jgi:hypothetical protein
VLRQRRRLKRSMGTWLRMRKRRARSDYSTPPPSVPGQHTRSAPIRIYRRPYSLYSLY